MFDRSNSHIMMGSVSKTDYLGCLVSPASIRGATGTNAWLVSGFDFSEGTGVPVRSASCLARTRSKSSFKANPWHNSDSSLAHKEKLAQHKSNDWNNSIKNHTEDTTN